MRLKRKVRCTPHSPLEPPPRSPQPAPSNSLTEQGQLAAAPMSAVSGLSPAPGPKVEIEKARTAKVELPCVPPPVSARRPRERIPVHKQRARASASASSGAARARVKAKAKQKPKAAPAASSQKGAPKQGRRIIADYLKCQCSGNCSTTRACPGRHGGSCPNPGRKMDGSTRIFCDACRCCVPNCTNPSRRGPVCCSHSEFQGNPAYQMFKVWRQLLSGESMRARLQR